MSKPRVHKISRTLVGTLVSMFVLLSINVLGDEWTTKHNIETPDYPPVEGDLTIKSNTTTIKSGGVLTVNGNMTVTGKNSLVLESNSTLIVNGDFTISNKIAINENANVVVNGGNVSFNSIENTINGIFVVNNGNVNINYKTNINGKLTVSGNVNATKSIDVNKGGELSIQGGNLTLTGNLTFNSKGTVIVSDRRKIGEKYVKYKDIGNVILQAENSSGGVNFNPSEDTESRLLLYGSLIQIETNANKKYNNIQIKYPEALIVIEGDYEIQDPHSRNKTNIMGGKDNTNVYVFGDSQIDGVKDSLRFVSDYHFPSISALLPIELTSFIVSATEYGYTFNWVTASEVENDYYTLEYSIDGVDFNEIDYVHGAGTTSETSEYTYRWDEAPEFDVVYFRLKQTDYNGEYTYSDVIVASRKKSSGANGTFRYGPLNLQIQDGELRYIVK